MLAAVTDDLAQCCGVEVVSLHDARLPEPLPVAGERIQVSSTAQTRAQFDRQCESADRTLLIAPELDGRLLNCCLRVEARRGRLLGPTSEVVRLASDKQLCCDYLQEYGIPVPRGYAWPLSPAEQRELMSNSTRFVVKRRDGAGSVGLQAIAGLTAFDPVSASLTGPLRVECYRAGTPTSAAFLCGTAGCIALEPCRQHLSDDGYLEYLGGSLPLPPPLRERALRLARQAIEALPTPTGYVGIDLILGHDAKGSEDVVIEINPRLTTSYVGLRAASQSNLAEAWLALDLGRSVDLQFRPGPYEFTADGRVSDAATKARSMHEMSGARCGWGEPQDRQW